MSWCVSLGFNFFGTLWASRTCTFSSFTRLGKFSFIIFQISFQFLALPLLPLAPLWFRCWNIKVFSRVLKAFLIFFWILVSSFYSGWMFISSFCFKSLIWVLIFFPSLLVPYNFWLWGSEACLPTPPSWPEALTFLLSQIFCQFNLICVYLCVCVHVCTCINTQWQFSEMA